MTPEQKAALNQLFDEIANIGGVYHNYSSTFSCHWKQYEETYNHLRSTFPDRVKEIMKPKPKQVWCHAQKDGDCTWSECPQLKNRKPSCPLLWYEDCDE